MSQQVTRKIKREAMNCRSFTPT